MWAQQEPQKSDKMEVADAKLCKEVSNRTPVGEATMFPKNSKVYLWMLVKGSSMAKVVVTWKGGGDSLSTALAIGGSPWRTWAYKTVRNSGDWTVEVADSIGTVLKELSFKVE
jgi:hypothetical protein